MKISINPAKTETKIVVLEDETISLTLTRDEAGHLAAILGKTSFSYNDFNGNEIYRRLEDFIGGIKHYTDYYQNLYVGEINHRSNLLKSYENHH